MSWKEELLKAVVSNFTHVVYGTTAVLSVTVYSFSGHNLSYKREDNGTTAALAKEVKEDNEKMRSLVQTSIENNNAPILAALKANTAVLKKLDSAVEKLEETVSDNIKAIHGLTSAVSDLRSWRARHHLRFYATQLHHEALLKKKNLFDD